jgi:hypothetical protein
MLELSTKVYNLFKITDDSFASLTLGLLGNNIGTTASKKELHKTLHTLHTVYSKNFESYLNYVKENIRLYKKTIQVELAIPDDPHHPYRHPPIPPFLPTIDLQQIFRRFANLSLWDEFKENGMIIIPDLMKDYDTPEIHQMIELEIKMYQYHSTQTNGTHGFVRPMFYSIIQQLFRQDPLWYAFQVACRPDNWIQLISYPYVAKGAQPGQKTEFLHMDINLNDFMDRKIGVNRLT